MKTIKLDFDGFWREPNKGSIPNASGVYCVYTCIHNKVEKNVSLKELLYIGEAEDANERVGNHDRLEDWEKALKQGQVLCYAFAPVSGDDKDRVEAALINAYKLRYNTEHKNNFVFPDTQVILSGKKGLLDASYIVTR